MNIRQPEFVTVELEDAKLLIYISVRDTYSFFMANNRSVEASKLVEAFKIDFANDDSVGKFLYKSAKEINEALSEIKQYYSSRREANDDKFVKDLSQHLFPKKGNYVKNINCPSILTYSGDNLVLKASEDARMARKEVSLLKKDFNTSLTELNNKIQKLQSELGLEINNLINFFFEDKQSIEDIQLLKEYQFSLLEELTIKLGEVRKECFNYLLLTRFINFSDIKKMIQLSIGLRDTINNYDPLKNYISSLLNLKRILRETPDSKFDVKFLHLSNFFNSRNKKQYIGLMNNEILRLENLHNEKKRSLAISDILSTLCDQEYKVFTEKCVNFQEGFFYNLKENLNTEITSQTELLNIIYSCNLSPDNIQLNHLLNVHADLLKLKNHLKQREAIFFDMDDIEDINDAINDEDCNKNLCYRDVLDQINVIIPLYNKLLSNEPLPETDIVSLNYQDTLTKLETTPKKIKEIIAEETLDSTYDDNATSNQTIALEENIKLLEENSKLRLQTATLRLEHNILQQRNNHLITSVTQLENENLQIKNKHSTIQTNYDNLQIKKVEIENKYLQLQNNQDRVKEQKSRLKQDNTRITIFNTELLSARIISNFNLFYKDYRKNAYKGFLGIFATHGNKGRETAYNFKTAFEEKMNSLKIVSTQKQATIIRMIQIAFQELIDEQDSQLTGNYDAYSLKTYLLAYNDYLNACSNNPYDATHGNPVKIYECYVADNTIPIKDLYTNLLQSRSRDADLGFKSHREIVVEI